MKTNFTLLFLLLSIAQIKAQDFTQSPYQDFRISSPIVADFNGDNFPDVLGIQFSSSNPTKVVLQLNDAVSPVSFTEKELNLTLEPAFGRLSVVDIDSDSDVDVIVAEESGLDLFVLQNDGAAEFTPQPLSVSGANNLRMADMDNDSDLDIIGLNTDNFTLYLYRNNGNLNFTTTTLLSNADNLELFEIADMDGDGDMDIVAGFDQFSGKQIAVYKNNGGNNFEEVVIVDGGFSSIGDLQIEDVDKDGRNDIVALQSFSCSAFLNQDNLNFMQTTIIPTSAIQRRAMTGDYNGDGRIDIILGSNSEGITWHKNLSNSPLEFETANISGISPVFSLLNADLDNDGDTDLVVSNGEFWWLENNIEQEPNAVSDRLMEPVAVFPNPFSEYIQVGKLSQDSYRIEISNTAGSVVYASATASGTHDLSALRPGFYFLSLINTQTQEVSGTVICRGE